MNDHVQRFMSARSVEPEGSIASARRWLSRHYARALFVGVFLLPTLIAAVYFGLIASDRYVSEARFVVRSASEPAAAVGAAAYLQDMGINRANDDAYAVQDYILSRDAMHAIMAHIDLRKIWGLPQADMFSRYGEWLGQDDDEVLFRHYLTQVKVDKNLETGITTLRVLAYRSEDAYAVAQLILRLSEAKVNAINTRARADRVASAQREMDAAARQLATATAALTSYRNSARLVNPEMSAQAGTRQQSSLETERAQVNAELQGMAERAPNNPAIPALRRRLTALGAAIASQANQLSGNDSALTGKVGGFEQLEVERELASKLYENAQNQLNTAIDAANRQQIFIETVIEPSLPDAPLEPRRLRYTFTVALLSFWAFLSCYLLLSGSREHLNLS